MLTPAFASASHTRASAPGRFARKTASWVAVSTESLEGAFMPLQSQAGNDFQTTTGTSRNLPAEAGPIMNRNADPKEFASPDNFGIVDSETTTTAERRSVKSRAPRRTIGFVTASSIVIANIIGTGIFTSLGFQLADIQSGLPLLMLWFIGGIAALCGALCYGELSAALPRSGGEYHFLSQIYHPALGFMAGFISGTVGFAAPIALAAMAFGTYFVGVFGVGSPVVLSFIVVWVVTAFHLRNLQIGSVFQNFATTVKLLLIGTLIIAGLFVRTKQPISFFPAHG